MTVLHGTIVLQLAGKLTRECDFDTIPGGEIAALREGFSPKP